jgi:hypothetical protein
MPLPILFGRSLAFAVHPAAAWRRLPPHGRAAMVASYGLASYVIVFAALALLGGV